MNSLHFPLEEFSHALLGHVHLRGIDIERLADLTHGPLINAVTFEDLELLGTDFSFDAGEGGLDKVLLPFLIPDALQL